MSDTTMDLLLDNIRAVLLALASMPTSTEARGLAERALECERRIKQWSAEPPTSHGREAMTRKVLGLHTSLSQIG